MTDIVVAEGYAAVGYEYINVDDCWLEKDRDSNGQLVPDRQRFPYGMKSLANYVRYTKFYCTIQLHKNFYEFFEDIIALSNPSLIII